MRESDSEGERSRRRANRNKGSEAEGKRTQRRKERVLHTRISEKLAEDIYRVAEDLRVPVSNLVRNVLEDTFSMVESVTDNVGDLIENVLDEAERARGRLSRQVQRKRRPPRRTTAASTDTAPSDVGQRERPEFPEILGWQPLILNRGQPCADCGKPLAGGEEAFVGLGASGLSPTYLCLACLQSRK